MNDGLPPQGLSEAQRASEVFHNFYYKSAAGASPSGGAAFIAHDGKWFQLHFPCQSLPGIIVLMATIGTTKKPANRPRGRTCRGND